MADPATSVLLSLVPFVVIFLPFYLWLLFGKGERPKWFANRRITVSLLFTLGGLGVFLFGMLLSSARALPPSVLVTQEVQTPIESAPLPESKLSQ